MIHAAAVRMQNDIYVFLTDEKGKTIEIHRESTDAGEHVGGIYVGRVRDISPNIEAAFVDIGTGRNAYLPFDQLISPVYTCKGSSARIQQGDEVLVQVIRDAVKTKAAALSTQITLRGRYTAVRTGTLERGVSRKIPKERREALRELVRDPVFSEYGVILRTNAAAAPDEQIIGEYTAQCRMLRQLSETAMHRKAPCCLYSEPPWLRHLADLPQEQTGQIVIEDETLYLQACSYLDLHYPEAARKVIRYSDPTQPLVKAWSLKERLQAASERKVWLKSGAYLLIEPTETLTAIDVNTGKINLGNRHRAEETFYRVNQEAAREIAAQIRLRGISGTIIVDFITMNEEAHCRDLLALFDRYLADDPVRTRVIDMTGLGLVEVTRRRGEKPL